jgi:hypothetical protein
MPNRVASRQRAMGMQIPTYVRNFYKYNVSYRLVTEARSADAPASGTAG